MGSTVIPVPYYQQLRQNQQTIFVPPNVNNTLQVHFLNALEGEQAKADKEAKQIQIKKWIGIAGVGLGLFFLYRILK